jgi:hypothetical protein
MSSEPRGKRSKGQPVDWDEVKKRRNIILTPFAWDELARIGEPIGISRSEVIERLVRGHITVS